MSHNFYSYYSRNSLKGGFKNKHVQFIDWAHGFGWRRERDYCMIPIGIASTKSIRVRLRDPYFFVFLALLRTSPASAKTKTSNLSIGRFDLVGGEGGIRTRDTLSGIHTFQACSFNHSDTSPEKGHKEMDKIECKQGLADGNLSSHGLLNFFLDRC